MKNIRQPRQTLKHVAWLAGLNHRKRKVMNGRRKHTIYQFAHWRGDRQDSTCFTRVCLPADAPTDHSNGQDRTQCARSAGRSGGIHRQEFGAKQPNCWTQ